MFWDRNRKLLFLWVKNVAWSKLHLLKVFNGSNRWYSLYSVWRYDWTVPHTHSAHTLLYTHTCDCGALFVLWLTQRLFAQTASLARSPPVPEGTNSRQPLFRQLSKYIRSDLDAFWARHLPSFLQTTKPFLLGWVSFIESIARLENEWVTIMIIIILTCLIYLTSQRSIEARVMQQTKQFTITAVADAAVP